MTAAYVLMQLNATDPRKVMKSIRAVTGVKQAHLLVGPTDQWPEHTPAARGAIVARILIGAVTRCLIAFEGFSERVFRKKGGEVNEPTK